MGRGHCRVGDLIEDEQQPVPVRNLSEHRQAFGRVGMHAAGTLEDRFDDDRGQLAGICGRDLFELRDPCPNAFRCGESRSWRTRRKDVTAEQTRECGVHAVDRVTDSHRRERVPVITAADAQEPLNPCVMGRAPRGGSILLTSPAV